VVSEAHHTVVILYEHALLGEGIAKYLHAQIGVEATVRSARDPEAVGSALALAPAVVIFESSRPFHQFELAALAPHAVLIDVSTVITRGSVLSPGAAGLEQILQAVRDSECTVAFPAETGIAETRSTETSTLETRCVETGTVESSHADAPPAVNRASVTRVALTSAAPAR
jgi:DNA-binding NarL/FixJ family response regulator